jgi:serine/threonine protein kinase/ankyrin repeat protein
MPWKRLELAEQSAGVDDEEETGLMKAAAGGQLDRECFLPKERGVDINAKSTRGRTALMKAAEGGHTGTVRYIAEERGADVDAKDFEGVTALMLAASYGDRIKAVFGTRALITAAERGNMEVVRCLAERVADVNDKDKRGRTALMKASAAGRADVVQYLAEERSADIEAKSTNGATALMMAANVPVVRVLSERGDIVNAKGVRGYEAPWRAANCKIIEVVQYLVVNGDADVNAKDFEGFTALMRAANRGNITVVQYLAGCGADVNIKSKDNLTALLVAAKWGNLQVVLYLAEEGGADLEAKDRDGHTILTMKTFIGKTTLMTAAEVGFIQLVRLLVKHGADVNAHDEGGCTALMWATDRGHVDIVRYLAEEGGADVDAQDENRQTALVHAVQREHLEIVRCLVQEYGADANVRDKRGRTAVRLAADRGFSEIQRALTPLLSTPLPPRISVLSRVSRLFKRQQAQSPELPLSCAIPPSEVALAYFCKSGNIGGEYRAKWLDADAVVKLFIPDASHSTFEKEVSLWQRLRHPNVIKMYGACSAGPQLKFFVCEYAGEGSLLEFIQSSSEKKSSIWKFLLDAALGLEYLHERGIIHGDVRCRNVLIGSDGVAKLSNFGLSGSSKRSRRASSGSVCSVRWQAPEVCEAKSPSFSSDVYSLGMTILEVVTGIPWTGESEGMVAELNKDEWVPEITDNCPNVVWSAYEPECPPGEARDLVWRMCCHDPKKRATLSSVVYELERLATEERSNNTSPEHASACTFDDYNEGDLKSLWMEVEAEMHNCDNEQHRQAFAMLQRVHARVQTSAHPPALLARFESLVLEFERTTKMTPEQARVLRLSATRATSNCFHAFQWQVQSLLSALGDATATTTESEAQWQQQRRAQIDLFVSGVSDTYLLLQDLKTREERAAFLRTLEAEMDSPVPKYTPGELRVMRKAYQDVKRGIRAGDLSNLTPEWFLPWYELITDKGQCLGSGGFGSVYRAKWLDSDVVVKLLGAASNQAQEDSLLRSPTAAPLAPEQRAEAAQAFRREVDIWFGFRHPHVVQLFGACHVGRPFFVCEFAPNGTLVSYLRAHPEQLWAKLHEAALGVQYLHARHVVHGDLKGNNVVIGSDRKAKVTDFGLSSVASTESKPQVSAAVHWVAPECLADPNARPTRASDIYSLGMCIVEALRVVEAAKAGKASHHCLPRCVDDANAVKHYATKGVLPARPKTCEDAAWQLVERMCTLAPAQRLQISTVVEELASLAQLQDDGPTHSASTDSVEVESVPRVMAEVRELLTQPRQSSDQTGEELVSLYASLWRRLECVHRQIKDKSSDECRAVFCGLIAEAHTATLSMLQVKASLLASVEITMRCYALGRRLDKFGDAFGLPVETEFPAKDG